MKILCLVMSVLLVGNLYAAADGGAGADPEIARDASVLEKLKTAENLLLETFPHEYIFVEDSEMLLSHSLVIAAANDAVCMVECVYGRYNAAPPEVWRSCALVMTMLSRLVERGINLQEAELVYLCPLFRKASCLLSRTHPNLRLPREHLEGRWVIWWSFNTGERRSLGIQLAHEDLGAEQRAFLEKKLSLLNWGKGYELPADEEEED